MGDTSKDGEGAAGGEDPGGRQQGSEPSDKIRGPGEGQGLRTEAAQMLRSFTGWVTWAGC